MSATEGWTESTEFNWDEVNDSAPPPLDEGVYECLVAEAAPQKTQKESKPGMRLVLTVTRLHGQSENSMSRKLYDNLTLTKEAAFRVKNLCKSIGVEPPKNSGVQAVGEFCGALVEAGSVWVKVERKTFNNKVTPKIARYMTAEQAAIVASGGELGDSGGSNGASNGDGAAPVAPRQRRRRG
jgi:hypothetical protein